MTSRSNQRKQRNQIEIREEFVDGLLPGICKQSKSPEDNWVKYLKLAIAVCRLAEYDYLSKTSKKEWKDSAKAFLFGKNTIFATVCRLLSINLPMARMKLIAYKGANKYGDPIFEAISDEYIDQYNLKLSPTAQDIEGVLKEKGNGRRSSKRRKN